MLVEMLVAVTVSSKNEDWFLKFNYDTSLKNSKNIMKVLSIHLPDNSKCRVQVICDNCLLFNKTVKRSKVYSKALRDRKDFNGLDLCRKCEVAFNNKIDKIPNIAPSIKKLNNKNQNSFVHRKKRIENKFGDAYTVLGESSHPDKIKIRHNICDYEWDVQFNYFINRENVCPRCNNVERYTKETFIARVEKLKSGEFSIVGEFTAIDKKITVVHNPCGFEWTLRTQDFMPEHKQCMNCADNISYGEKKIINYFIANDIKYIQNYSFDDCVDKVKLLFDFAVLNKDKNVDFLIEFDGIQHFKPIEWFGGDKAYQSQIKRDAIKNEYCDNKNIKLLRIPYWDYEKVEDILCSQLAV